MIVKFNGNVSIFGNASFKQYVDISLPYFINSNMVLQANDEVPIWGKGTPGDTVLVTFDNTTVQGTVSSDGNWITYLPSMTYNSTGKSLVVSSTRSNNIVTLTNVVVGDVWICSGQSNMMWGMAGTTNFGQPEISQANKPLIRLFEATFGVASSPQNDLYGGEWFTCSPNTVSSFPAVPYYFASFIHDSTSNPIGVIACGKGSSTMTEWASLDSLTALNPAYRTAVANVTADRVKECPIECVYKNTETYPTRFPTSLYYGMIEPIMPLAVKGMIWYQGESNAIYYSWARDLSAIFERFVPDLRNAWGMPTLPFFYVQLAGYGAVATTPSWSPWVLTRAAQGVCANLLSAGMVLSHDIGSVGIHPINKKDVGRRLSFAARNVVYGETNVVWKGPEYSSMSIEGNTIRVTFTSNDTGLTARNIPENRGVLPEPSMNAISGFEIAGADQTFYFATTAKIQNNDVIVASDMVANPVAVRYAWTDRPVGNLYNTADLPTYPFRTDTWAVPND